MRKQLFFHGDVGAIVIIVMALGVLHGCSDVAHLDTPEMSEEEVRLLHELSEVYPNAHIVEAYDSLKAIYPDARLTSQGGILVVDSVFTVINGVELKHQRWIYPHGVPRPPHDQQPWLEEYRKYNMAMGRDPNTPFPHKMFNTWREAAAFAQESVLLPRLGTFSE